MVHSDKSAAFVTGAAKRIGQAIAMRLADNGHAVAIHYRNAQKEAEAVCRSIVASGGSAVAIGCDLSDCSALAPAMQRAADALGPLTCLINNASAFVPDRFDDLTERTWDQHLAVNVKAPVFLTQAFAAALPQGRNGAVVNIIDQRVRKLTPQFASYTVSKAALWTATQTMAQAYAPRIRVNAIGPGPTLQSVRQDEAMFSRQSKATLLERGSVPEDIADAVMFLLNAPAITGQLIAVDAGQHLMWQTPDTAFDGD